MEFHLRRFRPLILAGLAIAALRLVLEFTVPEASMWFGLYVGMPFVILILGLRGDHEDLGFRALPGILLAGFLVWFVSGLVGYGLAAVLEWDFGRFAAERQLFGPGEGTAAHLGFAFLTALLSSAVGALWCGLFGALFIGLPASLRDRPTS